ncbi:MAG TPA: hypothetical protein ENJ17_01195 [Gammaproteobacteria bacterium]|nr:hypothetical protein [Gammaproteobacteria bacterium]
MTEFIREVRYFVLKYKDINKYLSKAEKEQLLSITNKISGGRLNDGRPMLDCVVVEQDWPEYEPTLVAIERRVTGA